MPEYEAERIAEGRAIWLNATKSRGPGALGAPIRSGSAASAAVDAWARTDLAAGLSAISSQPSTETRLPVAGCSVLQMQRNYGNRYVQRALGLARQGEGEAGIDPEVESAIKGKRGGGQQSGGAVQRKLVVGPPNDEQDADRVAKIVVSAAESSGISANPDSGSPGPVQRACACGNTHSSGECPECRKKRLGMRGDSGKPETVSHAKSGQSFESASRAPSGLSFGQALTAVVQRHGNGQPLDTDVLTFMQARFGQNFSSVRIHNDGRAAQAAGLTGANAFAVGEHVFWGQPSVSPHAPQGQLLLAHELVHVLQQRQAGVLSSTAADYEFVDGGASEREANRIAAEVTEGRASSLHESRSPGESVMARTARIPVRVSPAPRTAQRQDGGTQSFTDCVNSCLASQGIAGAITTMIWVACGILGFIGGVAGTIVEPGGGSLTGVGLALAGCIAVGTGFPIGVIIQCLKNCATD